MSWCNPRTKALNFLPKENSKTQQKKRDYFLNNPIRYICCEKCKKTNTTLYNIDGKYYCQNCK